MKVDDMSEPQRTVGSTVSSAREAVGMTIAQVAAATRIRATLIADIESDDFRHCGGDVYARGHLKSIATAMGIDPAALTGAFDRQRGLAPPPFVSVRPVEQPTRLMEEGPEYGLSSLAGVLGVSVRRGRSGPNWTAAMGLALAVIIGVGVVSYLSQRSSVPAAAAPSSSASTPAEPAPLTSPATEPDATDSPQPATSGPGDIVAAADGVTVRLTVTGRASWVRVTAGATGTTLFEGTLRLGEEKSFTDRTNVALVLGNAGAVTLNVNGRDLGAPGTSGQVLKVSFGPGDQTGSVA